MIKDEIVEVHGQKWKIRTAKSMKHALAEISFARATGSIGGITSLDNVKQEGGFEILADVIRLNEDGSEATPA